MVPSIMMFFLSTAYSCINSFVAIYGGLYGVENIGLFFATYAICMLFSRPFGGKVADKYGFDKTVIPGMFAFALSLILTSYSCSLPMFLLAGAVSAFGYGICFPLIQTLCMKLVSKERRGAAGNTNYMGIDCGYLVGPTLGGIIITHIHNISGSEVFGYVVMYRVMMIPILIALVIFWLKRNELLQRSKEESLCLEECLNRSK